MNITIKVNILCETKKGIYVETPLVDIDLMKGDSELMNAMGVMTRVWLPKSRINIEKIDNQEYSHNVTVPYWLAVKHNWAKKDSGFYTFNNYDDDYSRDPEFLYDWHHN